MVNISPFYLDTIPPNAVQLNESLAAQSAASHNAATQTKSSEPETDSSHAAPEQDGGSGDTALLASKKEAKQKDQEVSEISAEKEANEPSESISKPAEDASQNAAVGETSNTSAPANSVGDESLESEMENIAL